MHCGGCDNIPFWRWLKVIQTFTTSITCNDFDGQYLSNLQPNNVTDCFSEFLCTFELESIIKFIAYTQIIWTWFSMKKSLMIPKV